MVENDNNVGFKLFLKPLDANLVQALNDLLDDSKGQYFVDDSEYADIALNMINYISAKIRRYVLPIGYLGIRNDIAVKAFSGPSHCGQCFTENPVKVSHSS